ncbi:outer membrane beta-barrel protein [Zobellia roscoffensis]|uniref:outer membrane beta-barrel protein n=1 Tax=Zobellia roscoffensis TaxID=2779508 RepID=UPI00188D4154|nr:outer membrane beta-barrel protein [Zobellia roscoffensis]
MSKKNIENLFQEKFRDFEEVPDPRVWTSIEASLNKKKKKRAFPIWWTLGGAAAALVIGLVAFYPFETKNEAPSSFTDVDQKENTIENTPKNTNEFILDNTDEVVENESSISTYSEITPESSNKETKHKTTTTLNADEIQTNSHKSTYEKSGLKSNITTEVAQTEKKPNGTENTRTIMSTSNKPDYASNLEKDNQPITASNHSPSNEEHIETSKTNVSDSIGIASNINNADSPETKLRKDDDPASVSQTEIVENITSVQKEKEENEMKSIFDEIEAEEEIVSTEKTGRWSAGPNVAPVYYNAIGDGSPVNSIFNENSKSGNTNLSYGLTVAYALNDKLSIRSGLNKVDYGYDTNDVGFTSTLQEASSEKIQNINYASTAKNIVVTGQNSNFNSLANADAMFAFEVTDANPNQRNGTMAQQFGYLEVPLELDYALIDRKFGLNILGGVSSLFLIDNSVTLTSGELTTEIGEANNVNSVNFSTNIGFGVNYKFTPKIRFNVEPVFKYQLNTFSDVSGDFNPFTIGVYSGLNFKF